MLRVLLYLLCAAGLFAQPGTITTIAGNYSAGFGLRATEVQLSRPEAVTLDAEGNVFVAESSLPQIRRVDRNGIVHPFAGRGRPGQGWVPPDGSSAASVDIGSPLSMLVRKDGTHVFSNAGVIFEINGEGKIKRIAGSDSRGFFGDGGPATNARMDDIRGLLEDGEGNLLFCDSNNHRVRKIATDGTISTVAGNGLATFAGDGGPATEASLFSPTALLLQPDGSLLIADYWNNRIRRVGLDGTITTFAGGGAGFTDDVPAADARFYGVSGIAMDQAGRILVADVGNRRVRVIDTDGFVRTVMGGGAVTDPGAGIPPDTLRLAQPSAVAVSPDGRVFITDQSNQMVLVVEGGLVKRFMGAAPPWEGIPLAMYTGMIAPGRVVAGTDGSLFLPMGGANRLFRVSPDGVLQHLAGSGAFFGPSSELQGPRMDVLLPQPLTALLDREGNVLVVNYSGNNVVRLQSDGTIVPVAGTGGRGSTGDGGPARQATLNAPTGAAFDAEGNLYVSEDLGHRMRKVSPDGTISTFAGAGVPGFGGDNGPGEKAGFNSVSNVAVDSTGNVYISDASNNRIRKIDKNGIVTTFAGTGVGGFSGDGGPATDARIRGPNGLAVDKEGNLYFADQFNHRVRRVDKRGVITTVAGNGVPAFAGDGGPATQATLHAPRFVAFDQQGNLLISDVGNNRIRKVQGYAPYNFAPQALQFNFALNAPAETRAVSLTTLDSDPRGFSLSTDSPWLRASAPVTEITIDKPTTLEITASPAGLAKGRYLGRVILRDLRTGDQFPVPVTMTVSGTPQQLRLGQTGFTFATLQGSGNSFQQYLSVLNAGTGSMAWTATSSTLQGGNWLAIASTSGQSTPGAPAPPIRLSVNPAALGPGVYYGLVTVNAPQADNAPQSAIVILNVLGVGTPPGPQLDTSGVLFNAVPGQTLERKSVQLLNLSGAVANYTASPSFPDARRWFTVAPASGSVAVGQGAQLVLTPNTTGLQPGVYRATLNVRIQPGDVTRSATVVLVIPRASTGNASAKQAAADCQPKSIAPVFLSPGAGFFTNAGWPANVEVEALTDCGQPLTAGRVTVSFSTGEPALSLSHSGQGRWSGTWISKAANQTSTRLTLRIETEAPRLTAQAELTIGIRQNTQQPIIEKAGIRSLASMSIDEPLATGSLTAVLGSGLASSAIDADSLPLPVQLRDTRVLVAGRLLPLRKAAEGRVEAFLSQGLPEFTPLQMIVQRGQAYSAPEPLVLVNAAPAVFTVDGTGRNQGMIYVTNEELGTRVADPSRPARPGEEIVLYASGLGPVDNPPEAGAGAPADPLLPVTTELTLTIEGKPAVIKQAVLAPGLVGVYRVTAIVPDSLENSASARLVLTANSIPSSPVTLAIRGAQ